MLLEMVGIDGRSMRDDEYVVSRSHGDDATSLTFRIRVEVRVQDSIFEIQDPYLGHAS